MKNKYIDLIEQTADFPTDEFKVIDNELYFNDIPLMDIIEQYGTPLKITYLPHRMCQVFCRRLCIFYFLPRCQNACNKALKPLVSGAKPF